MKMMMIVDSDTYMSDNELLPMVAYELDTTQWDMIQPALPKPVAEMMISSAMAGMFGAMMMPSVVVLDGDETG
jgi:hypothetical protein